MLGKTTGFLVVLQKTALGLFFSSNWNDEIDLLVKGTEGYSRRVSAFKNLELKKQIIVKTRTVEESTKIFHLGDNLICRTSICPNFLCNLAPELRGNVRSLGEDVDTESQEGSGLHRGCS